MLIHGIEQNIAATRPKSVIASRGVASQIADHGMLAEAEELGHSPATIRRLNKSDLTDAVSQHCSDCVRHFRP
jgi:hypothetical protein